MNPRMSELYPPISLGMTAEVVAEKYDISREDQDHFALRSHRLALEAVAAGRFDDEIEPLEAPTDHRRREATTMTQDEGPSARHLLGAARRPAPGLQGGGHCHRGELVTHERWRGRPPAGHRSRSRQSRPAAPGPDRAPPRRPGVHPDVMGIGPVPASEKALARAGIGVGDLDLVEVNEAFASQAVACLRLLELDEEKVNVNGGAIAIGHPLGASGARILVTLVHELARRQGRYGLATMCIGVGQGIAVVVERV